LFEISLIDLYIVLLFFISLQIELIVGLGTFEKSSLKLNSAVDWLAAAAIDGTNISFFICFYILFV